MSLFAKLNVRSKKPAKEVVKEEDLPLPGELPFLDFYSFREVRSTECRHVLVEEPEGFFPAWETNTPHIGASMSDLIKMMNEPTASHEQKPLYISLYIEAPDDIYHIEWELFGSSWTWTIAQSSNPSQKVQLQTISNYLEVQQGFIYRYLDAKGEVYQRAEEITAITIVDKANSNTVGLPKSDIGELFRTADIRVGEPKTAKSDLFERLMQQKLKPYEEAARQASLSSAIEIRQRDIIEQRAAKEREENRLAEAQAINEQKAHNEQLGQTILARVNARALLEKVRASDAWGESARIVKIPGNHLGEPYYGIELYNVIHEEYHWKDEERSEWTGTRMMWRVKRRDGSTSIKSYLSITIVKDTKSGEFHISIADGDTGVSLPSYQRIIPIDQNLLIQTVADFTAQRVIENRRPDDLRSKAQELAWTNADVIDRLQEIPTFRWH